MLKAAAAAFLFAAGCVPEQATDPSPAASASAPMPLRPRFNPNMPLLAVHPGKGVGPIRIGANVGTIERLMRGPCELRSAELCRYVTRGLDFHLVGGITRSIEVHRPNRPAGRTFEGRPMEFGYFPGMIPPDLRFGMIPQAIAEHLGPPERIEKVPGPNPRSTVEVHFYPGMALEYDYWHKTKKLILGGIRIFSDPRIDQRAPTRLDAGSPVPSEPDAGSAPGAEAGAPSRSAKPPADAGPPVREPPPR